jgi:hypothetical protein
MTARTLRTAHTMDPEHWNQLKRRTRAHLAAIGHLAEPLAPGEHDVAYDTHRTRAEREQADR